MKTDQIGAKRSLPLGRSSGGTATVRIFVPLDAIVDEMSFAGVK
jgi:hypothetical protein